MNSNEFACDLANVFLSWQPFLSHLAIVDYFHMTMLSLCLSITVAGGKGGPPRRQVIQLPATASLYELQEEAQKLLTVKDAAASSLSLTLQTGFPPRPLEITADRTLHEAGIQNQERITVIVAQKSSKGKGKTKSKSKTTAAAAKTKPRKTTSKKAAAKASPDNDEDEFVVDDSVSDTATPSSSSPPLPRSKRAAAQKATESFAEVIQAQDALMAEQTKKRRTTSSNPSKRPRPTNSTTATSPRPVKKFTATTAGRRLQDGATVASPTRKTTSRRRNNNPSSSSSSSSSTTDPSVALLETLESSSAQGRLMRKGWKDAVQDRYEQNKAVARLAAIPHNVTMQLLAAAPQRNSNNSTTTSDMDDATLKVTFAKGVQGRGDYHEQVQYLPKPVLQSVIAAIHPTNPEALRPSNLALLSPRVLWSLVYHAMISEGSTTTSTVSSVEDALRTLQPSLDWSFLKRRPQTLSAKARENLRQANADTTTNDWEAAAAAIASVEHAMDHLQTLDRSQRQERLGQAAELRQQQQSSNNVQMWTLETPTEEDDDELLECIQEAPDASVPSLDMVQRLKQNCGIYNWRQLANASVSTVVQQLYDTNGVGDDNVDQNENISRVESWIVRAQQESVDEIIVEICDGNVAAVTMLGKYAQSGTPRDLANWHPIVHELETILRQGADKELGNNVPTSVLLKKWCEQAQWAMEQFPWLAAFTTPLALED